MSDLPRKLGKYVLERRIAAGGMGEVYFGKMAGVEGFERDVAIKTLLPHLSADPSFVRMIVQEAKLTVRLNHPNIVTVYDFAKEGDEYYIAMEYIAGVNLSTLLGRCREQGLVLPIELCVHFTVQILRGLAYAHELRDAAGKPMHILHRDVTPHNIMITQDGWAKLTDFGIAQARDQVATSQVGTFTGKLAYAAPEQLRPGELDHRVDVFAAGIVLWESLSMRRLFRGHSDEESVRLVEAAVVPSLGTIRTDAEPIENVLKGALAKSPADRFWSATMFADSLLVALRPRSFDDLGRVARSFFVEHPDLFAPESEPNPATDADLSLPRVTPATTRREWTKVAIACAAMLAFAVVVGLTLRSLLEPRAPEPTHVTAPVPVPNPTPAPAPTPAVEEPSEPPLTVSEIEAQIHSRSKTIVRCLHGADRATLPVAIDAHITIEPSGKVSLVELQPPLAQARVSSCLVRNISNIKFRKHSGQDLKVIIPLKIRVL